MSDLIDLVFSFRGLTLVLIGVSIWLRRRIPPGFGRRVALTVLALYLLMSVYIVPYGVGRILVWGYRPLGPADGATGQTVIIVLGSGESGITGWGDKVLPMLNPSGAARILETSRTYLLYPDAWVISSGGTSETGVATSADVMAAELTRLGVPADRIILETTSRNTHDEAVAAVPLVAALRPSRVVVVTSDVHMRRALGTFRAVGIDAVPAIARDPFISQGWRFWAIPGPGLGYTAEVIHEMVGLGYYAARGWWK
jgi:uncharacterized SAM-binding protein YcdF (DUF218 family)